MFPPSAGSDVVGPISMVRFSQWDSPEIIPIWYDPKVLGRINLRSVKGHSSHCIETCLMVCSFILVISSLGTAGSDFVSALPSKNENSDFAL